MLINSDTDAAIFIINCTFTSVFCLRCEYEDLKSSVLLVLALSDWLSVFSRTLTTLTHDINLWSAATCVCEQPQVLLQTGKMGCLSFTWANWSGHGLDKW